MELEYAAIDWQFVRYGQGAEQVAVYFKAEYEGVEYELHLRDPLDFENVWTLLNTATGKQAVFSNCPEGWQFFA